MKLTEKLGLLFVLFSYFALGNLEDDIVYTFGFFLGDYSPDFIFLKLMLFIMLFAVLFVSLFRTVFTGNRFIAGVVALIMAIVGVRFLPYDILELYIVPWFFIFILLLVFLLPYFLLKALGIKISKKLYLFLYVVFVAALWYMNKFSFSNDIYYRISDFFYYNPWVYLIMLGIIAIYLASKLNR